MRTEEINEFQSLKDNWNGLLKSSVAGNNVFLTWEWLSTWWKHFGCGKKLLILTVKDMDRILAVAPLMLSKYRLPAVGNIRRIEFIGNPHSDYHDAIILEKEKDCLELVIDYLQDSVTDWDWIELKEVPEQATTAQILGTQDIGPSLKLKVRKRICNICPFISLPHSTFDLKKIGLTKKKRQNLRRGLRQLNQEHHVEIKRYNEAGYSAAEAMDFFVDLHEKKWASVGLPGIFGREGKALKDFHKDIAQVFADKGWLGLYFLIADGEPASAMYAFEYGQKMYAYLSGWDPKFEHYSVGNLMHMFLLEKCWSNAFHEYDFMRGDEQYKFSWTTAVRRNLEIRLVPRNLPSEFRDFLTWNITLWLARSASARALAGRLGISLRADQF